MDICPYVIQSRSELGSKIISSWTMKKSFQSHICFNIYCQQKFYLNEKLLIVLQKKKKNPIEIKQQVNNGFKPLTSYVFTTVASRLKSE